MSAGLANDDPWADRQEAMTDAEFDAVIGGGVRAMAVPGTTFEYSNLGYALLGRVIQDRAGRRFHDVVRDEILDRSGSTAPGGRSVPSRRRRGHRVRADRRRLDAAPFSAPGAFSPIGGLFSTVTDLGRLDAVVHRRRRRSAVARQPHRDVHRGAGPRGRGRGRRRRPLRLRPGRALHRAIAAASFAAYALEKKISMRPGEVPFGKGNIRGVASPESANNAGAQTSFIPLLTLGIPPNAVMALMVGAMTIHNIQPGPQVMTSNPELFWGLIASMWIGNAMLIILNLPLIGMWIKLLTVPYKFLFPAIVLFCAIGVYSTNNNTFDIWMVAAFGFIGYLFIKLRTEPAPLLLGFILGPMMEENLRRALLLSRGSWAVFVTRPLSAGLLVAACLLLGIVLLPSIKAKREEAFVEE